MNLKIKVCEGDIPDDYAEIDGDVKTEVTCPSCKKVFDEGETFYNGLRMGDWDWTTRPVFECRECPCIGVLSRSFNRDGDTFTVGFLRILRASFGDIAKLRYNYPRKIIGKIEKILGRYLYRDLVDLITEAAYPTVSEIQAGIMVDGTDKLRRDKYLQKYNLRDVESEYDEPYETWKIDVGFTVNSFNACKPYLPYPCTRKIEMEELQVLEFVDDDDEIRTAVMWDD